jgi:hypothetical protein
MRNLIKNKKQQFIWVATFLFLFYTNAPFVFAFCVLMGAIALSWIFSDRITMKELRKQMRESERWEVKRQKFITGK